MVTKAEWDALEVDRLTAETDKNRAEATKFRHEGTMFRRYDELVKLDLDDRKHSMYDQRIYEFTGYVDEESVGAAITTLSEWRARSAKPMTLRLWSEGGSIVDGFALFDYVLALRAGGFEVDTVVLGWAASMGGVLMQCGTHRYIGPSAHVLIHEGRVSIPVERLTNIKDEVKLMEMLEERCLDVLSERSTLSSAQMKKRMGTHDWWLNANEAIELGLADDLWPPRG